MVNLKWLIFVFVVLKGSSRSSSMEKNGVSDKEKFAPRFDGLRFIETLVTAHR